MITEAYKLVSNTDTWISFCSPNRIQCTYALNTKTVPRFGRLFIGIMPQDFVVMRPLAINYGQPAGWLMLAGDAENVTRGPWPTEVLDRFDDADYEAAWRHWQPDETGDMLFADSFTPRRVLMFGEARMLVPGTRQELERIVS